MQFGFGKDHATQSAWANKGAMVPPQVVGRGGCPPLMAGLDSGRNHAAFAHVYWTSRDGPHDPIGHAAACLGLLM